MENSKKEIQKSTRAVKKSFTGPITDANIALGDLTINGLDENAVQKMLTEAMNEQAVKLVKLLEDRGYIVTPKIVKNINELLNAKLNGDISQAVGQKIKEESVKTEESLKNAFQDVLTELHDDNDKREKDIEELFKLLTKIDARLNNIEQTVEVCADLAKTEAKKAGEELKTLLEANNVANTFGDTMDSESIIFESADVIFNEAKALLDNCDIMQAITKFKEIAERGHIEAQYMLGECYERGGTTAEEKEAFNWYLQAAKQGHQKAINSLVEMQLDKGQREEVIALLEEAIEQGSVDARDSLSTVLLDDGRWDDAVAVYKDSA